MNEELLTNLTKDTYVELINYIRALGAIASEQLPQVGKDIITWTIINNAVWGTLAAVILIVILYLTYKLYMCMKDDFDEDALAVIFVLSITIIGICAWLNTCLVNIAQAIYAPRIVIIDYLSRLI